MSDLAKAVFGGQLMGHVIAGEELTQSVIADAAQTASLAESLSVTDDCLNSTEKQILEAKVAESVVEDGSYDHSDLMQDQLELGPDATIADSFLP